MIYASVSLTNNSDKEKKVPKHACVNTADMVFSAKHRLKTVSHIALNTVLNNF